MLSRLKQSIDAVLSSGDMPTRRPELRAHFESSVAGLYVIGDLAGAPVIKYAMAQGVEVIEHIAAKPDAKSGGANVYDLLIAGAGAAGLNAALAAQERGLRALVLEKNKIANTIEDFPDGKWVYAEPDSSPPKGKLWLDGARKEDLIARWKQIVRENRLEIRTEEGLASVEKQRDGNFVVRSDKGEYRARRVILATGQRGNPRKLGVRGEDREGVYHRLYSPRHYHDKDILVVGGGNSAVEAALVLSEQNRVRLSYRGGELARIFKDNERKLNEAVAQKRIELILNSNVNEFSGKFAALEIDRGGHREARSVPCDYAFVLIGAELPVKFLKSLGIRMENEWNGRPLRAIVFSFSLLLGLWFFGGHATDVAGIPFSAVPSKVGVLLVAHMLGGLLWFGWRGDRYAWLGVSFLAWYTIYGVKSPGAGEEFWPFRHWGFQFFSFLGRPATFWYTVLYTVLMTGFGFQALKRWGIDRRDRFQIWRYVSLLSFQWIFFFLIPEFLFQWAVKYQWVGAQLANDPQFAGQAWRSYGLIYAWPLFFYSFFYDPHKIWILWGVFLTFILIPLFVLFQGKRYCSWICGCGGLAETFGDRWRHLAPKGRTSMRWEWMNLAILIFAAVVTAAMLFKDALAWLRAPALFGLDTYHLYVDIWLVGILPVTLYPFLGGKVWCRYWCPLAKLMHLFSAMYTRMRVSRFRIVANDKCIGCTECTRNCQVGIDVMSYALKQQPLDNATSSCIGCGICVSVCPMDVLSFGSAADAKLVQIQPMPGA
ncbi:MAG: NAD(P)-binding domain-containing protein [Acidobacteria bacterium]|nr:NAD(P)-binding domain-containing protein [Acidobacteriota bacterium]